MILINLNRKEIFWRPKIILSIIIFLQIILGNINLLFFQNIIGWYGDIKSEKANFYALLGYIVFISILLLREKKRNQIRFNMVKTIPDNEKIYRFVFILSLISILVNIENLSVFGGNIFFKNNATGYERFDILLPFEKGMILSSFLLTITSLQFFIDNKRKVNYAILFIVNLFISSSIGSRHLILMPLITSAFFLTKNEFIKVKFVLIFSLIGFILLIGLSIARGDYNFEGATNWQSIQGNEYRDYIRLTNEPNLKFQNGSTIFSVVLNSIPKQIYSIFDFDKQNYRIYSAYILSDIWGADTGQRAGIWGEFYLNFGYLGLIGCFVLFGFIVRYFDLIFISTSKNRKDKILILSYVYSLFVFSILGAWATIGDDIGSYGLLHIFFFLISTKKPRPRKEL